jgi:hypothetical protein
MRRPDLRQVVDFRPEKARISFQPARRKGGTMTDDRNVGGVPPASAPAAPPPLASAPAPAAPLPPQVAPPYYPPTSNSKTGLWVFLVILAFAVGVGGTILTLWLTGELWNSSARYTPSSYTSSMPTGTGSAGGTGYTAPTPPPSTTGGYAPTADVLPGTWGPGCPGSNNQALTLYADGSASSDGENGTWSLNGNYVTLNNGREVMTLYWEMVSNDTARVRRSGDSQTRTVSRCS